MAFVVKFEVQGHNLDELQEAMVDHMRALNAPDRGHVSTWEATLDIEPEDYVLGKTEPLLWKARVTLTR